MKAARRLNKVYVLDEKGNVIALRESAYRFPKSFFLNKKKEDKSFVRLELSTKKKSNRE